MIGVLIANIWIGIPFNLVIMYSGLQNIPEEVYEAASLDGANGWQKFWRITFPMLRPVTAITLLLGLVYTLKVFDIIWIMTGAARRFVHHLRDLVLPARVRGRLSRSQRGGGGRQPADRDRLHLRVHLHPHPAPDGGASNARTKRILTSVVGVILTAIMLFPLYWMVNVSPTQPERLRKDPPDLFPVNPTFEGYAKVLSDRLPYLFTSLVVGLGAVVLTLLLAAPAAFALAKLRPRGGRAVDFVMLIAQMIPGIIMAMGFYLIFFNWGLLDSFPG